MYCYSVKDIEHERTWLNGSIFEVEVRKFVFKIIIIDTTNSVN